MKPITTVKDKQYEKLVASPIPQTIIKLAIPSILSMLVSAIYNMADTYFVGGLGVSASGAVGIVFPIMMIIQAIAFMFGMGANSLISRFLGAKNVEKANLIASTALISCLTVSILFSVISLLVLDPMLRILGSTETIMPFARDYAEVILLGSPFIAGSFVLNHLLRSQGLNIMSMVGLTVGGILNIILDPIFINVLNLGIAGAAWATILSQFIGFSILVIMIEKKSVIRLRPKYIARTPQLYLSILAIGSPSLLRQGLGSLAVMILNNRASAFGDPPMAALSIVGRIASLFIAFIIGAGQAFQPVAGYNFGAKRYDRVHQAYRFTLQLTLAITAVISIVLFIFAGKMIAIFQPNAEVVEIGAFTLRLQCITFALQPFLIMTNMLYQSTGRARGATILAALRQGIYFYPFVFILPSMLGLTGVLITQPVADVLSCFTAIPFALIYLRKLKNMHEVSLQP